MAEQILSQVEVDALLKGLSNGEIATGQDKGENYGGVTPYDFANQSRAVRGRMPGLEMINEKFCRSARYSLFNFLRKTVDITPEGIKTLTYGEFLRNLKVPSSLNVFQPQPLRGQGVLSLDPNLVFIIVDSYFGGDGKFHTRVEGRDFTNVEQAVIRKVVDLVLGEMNAVWKAMHQVEFRFLRSEMNPQFVNVIPQTDPVVVSSFNVEIDSHTEKFDFTVPYAALDPIKDKIHGTYQAEIGGEDKRWISNMKDRISSVPFAVTAELGNARITVEDLMNLKTGDVIQLDRKAKDPLEVFVDGLPKFLAKAGVTDSHYSLQILSVQNERG